MKSLLLKTIFLLLIWMNTSGYMMPVMAYTPPDKLEKLLKQGNKHLEDGFFYKAIQFYQEALGLAPDHTYAHYQLAECYRNLLDYQKAKYHYDAVYQANQEQYPLSGYYLASMFKLSGDYTRSVTYFDLFINFAKKKKFQDRDMFLQQAQLEMEGSIYAINDMMKPKGEFELTRLPGPVNTEYNDYAATVYHEDSCIAFTSARTETKGNNLDEQYGEFFSDHYLFNRNKHGEWEDISSQNNFIGINTNFSEGTGVFNKEKNEFYFTGCYHEGYCHIYKSELKNGKWQTPVPLNEKVNAPEYNSKQPSLSPGGDTLFFVSNRPGGLGMQDIWMSTLSQEGSWQAPVNLGPDINTSQNELSPYYYPSEHVLFFSSNGRKGYGGYDVYVTTLSADSPTPVVVNLSKPFNSAKDDLYLTLGDEKGFFSTNRGNVDGNFDIYTFNITTKDAVLLSLHNGGKDDSVTFKNYFDILRFFTKEDQEYFDQLPLREKARVKRYIEGQSFQKALSEKAALNESLMFFYEALPAEEKEIIDRLATAQKNFLLKENNDVLLNEDQYYYENLPVEKKDKIQKIIEARAFQKILQEQEQKQVVADAQYFRFYETLPTEEQEKIDKAIVARKDFLTKSFQSKENISLNLEDLFFYETLPSEEKEKIERIIAAKRFNEEVTDDSEAYDMAMMFYEQLPLEKKERVNRIVQTRKFATKMLEDKAVLPADAENDHLDIGTLTIGNPQNITIEGRLVAHGKKTNAVNVILVSGNSQKVVTTNQNGEFKFFNVDYHQNQKILFGQDSAKFMQLAQYTLEELKITVLQDTIIEETFDNIYFATDQYAISDSGTVILDSLADFHFKYPDVQIEIIAYADTVGSDAYNKELSYKRASETYKYLISKGVNQTALHIFAKGKESPRKGKNLQYSRRVEFGLQGVATSYNPTKEVYVIYPEPDLEEIAHKYHLSLPALMELNREIKGKPQPFTPIRIIANGK